MNIKQGFNFKIIYCDLLFLRKTRFFVYQSIKLQEKTKGIFWFFNHYNHKALKLSSIKHQKLLVRAMCLSCPVRENRH